MRLAECPEKKGLWWDWCQVVVPTGPVLQLVRTPPSPHPHPEQWSLTLIIIIICMFLSSGISINAI